MLNRLQVFFIVGFNICLSNPTLAGVKYIDMTHASAQSVSLIVSSTKDTTATKQEDIDNIIVTNARKYDISPALLRAVIKQESNFNTLGGIP